jgi:coenzyme F420-reducing hydrogenase beta subunit
MKSDNQGFLQVKLSKNNCIECGICEKVCPILAEKNENERETEAFAVKNNSESERKASSSGGVFVALANNVLDEGGVVCAARFDETFHLIHDFCERKEDLKPFLGSKYLQSDMRDCFKKTKELLNEERLVLFVGTPCQIMGLKLYLRKEYQNLIATEVVCHGVPSPMVWEKYLNEICKQKKISRNEVKNISFRNKDKSWRVFNLKIEGKEKTILKESLHDNIYMRGFLKNLFLRQSCHHCPAKNFASMADISLADYWGIDRFHPEMDDNKGVSAVILYNKKISLSFKKLSLSIKETNLRDILSNNSALAISAKAHPKRDEFFEKINKEEFHKLANEFVGEPTLEKIKRKTRWFLSDIKSKILKKGGF